jgi:integrase
LASYFRGGCCQRRFSQEIHNMPHVKMTKTAIDRLAAPDPSGRPTLYWADGNATPGLGVLVSGVSANKSWVCQASLPNGKARRVTIGPVATFTPDEAWAEARPKLADILSGRDPRQSADQKALATMTLGQVLDHYLEAKSKLSTNTREMYRGLASRHLAPLMKKTLREITSDVVQKRFRAITGDVAGRREAGAIRGGVNVDGRASANASLRLLSAIWNFQAARDSDLGANPVASRLREQWHSLDRRKRRVPSERMREFYQAALHLPSDIQRDLVILALFTGMRSREAAGLRWSEVDLPLRMLRLPAGRMKAKQPFDLPMNDVVYRLLLTRRFIGREGEFVFPGYRRGKHTSSFTWALRQIEQATGIRVSPHDLRRSYASVAATVAIPPIAIKQLISHTVGSDVTAGYALLPENELRRAGQVVADKLKELCAIETPTGAVISAIA